MFIDHGPDLGILVIIEKKKGGGATEYGGIDFEIGAWGTRYTPMGTEENFMQRFFIFMVTKRMTFKSSLDTCTFMPSLLDYFDYSSYGSQSRKRYTSTLLLICLAGGFGNSFN